MEITIKEVRPLLDSDTSHFLATVSFRQKQDDGVWQTAEVTISLQKKDVTSLEAIRELAITKARAYLTTVLA